MSLFPEIDEKQTIKNVRYFFETDLSKLESTAGSFLKSVQLSTQPTGKSNQNGALEQMTRQVWAREQIGKIIEAVEYIPEPYRDMIKLRYFDGLPWQAIEERCYIGERMGQIRIRKAFLHFAYAYHGDAQLLVELNKA